MAEQPALDQRALNINDSHNKMVSVAQWQSKRLLSVRLWVRTPTEITKKSSDQKNLGFVILKSNRVVKGHPSVFLTR